MKKWLKWLLIAIGAILIGFIIYIAVKQTLREEAVLTFPDTVVVNNATDKDVDKIVKALAYNVLGYDTIDILIAKVPPHLENIDNIDIRAFIVKSIFADNVYTIYLSETLKPSEYKKVLSHEFIHVDQFQKGDLIQMGLRTDGIIYKGDTIFYKETDYDRRPHELDAYKKQGRIYNELDKVLYK